MSVLRGFAFVFLMSASFFVSATGFDISGNDARTQSIVGFTEVDDIWSFDVAEGFIGSISFSSTEIPGVLSINGFSSIEIETGIYGFIFTNITGLDNLYEVSGLAGGVDAFFGGSYNVVTSVTEGSIPAVPLPAAAWLMGTALVGLVSFGRRKTTVAA